ncbi:MAG: hypothetical protein D6781_02470 [Verrucomicrobia bacterium]|nr:MAG: hypothetical protein D6781_02470 [Verrucomicrobiota bacterium]
MNSPPTSLRFLLPRTIGMTAGGLLVAQLTARGWPYAIAACGALLTAAALLPPARPHLARLLKALEHALLAAITWLLLGLVYALIFVPGRLFIRGEKAIARPAEDQPSRQSFWERPEPARKPFAGDFERTF